MFLELSSPGRIENQQIGFSLSNPADTIIPETLEVTTGHEKVTAENEVVNTDVAYVEGVRYEASQSITLDIVADSGIARSQVVWLYVSFQTATGAAERWRRRIMVVRHRETPY